MRVPQQRLHKIYGVPEACRLRLTIQLSKTALNQLAKTSFVNVGELAQIQAHFSTLVSADHCEAAQRGGIHAWAASTRA